MVNDNRIQVLDPIFWINSMVLNLSSFCDGLPRKDVDAVDQSNCCDTEKCNHYVKERLKRLVASNDKTCSFKVLSKQPYNRNWEFAWQIRPSITRKLHDKGWNKPLDPILPEICSGKASRWTMEGAQCAHIFWWIYLRTVSMILIACLYSLYTSHTRGFRLPAYTWIILSIECSRRVLPPYHNENPSPSAFPLLC